MAAPAATRVQAVRVTTSGKAVAWTTYYAGRSRHGKVGQDPMEAFQWMAQESLTHPEWHGTMNDEPAEDVYVFTV